MAPWPTIGKSLSLHSENATLDSLSLAHALASYGHYRYTADLDVFLERSDLNKERLGLALSDFGIPVTAEALDYLFSQEREMLELGREPVAIDLLTFLDGLKFEDAWENRTEHPVYGQKAWILSVEDYVKTKIASGRTKDKLDLQSLRDLGYTITEPGEEPESG